MTPQYSQPDPAPRFPRSLATHFPAGLGDKCATGGCPNLAGAGPFCVACSALADEYDRLEILGTLISFPAPDPEPGAPAALPQVEEAPEETEQPIAAHSGFGLEFLSESAIDDGPVAIDFDRIAPPPEGVSRIKPVAQSRFAALPDRKDCGIAPRRGPIRRLLATVAAVLCILVPAALAMARMAAR